MPPRKGGGNDKFEKYIPLKKNQFFLFLSLNEMWHHDLRQIRKTVTYLAGYPVNGKSVSGTPASHKFSDHFDHWF